MHAIQWSSNLDPLIESINGRFRAVNYSEDLFPAIARDALESFEAFESLDLPALANFVLETSVPQQKDSIFSDLPITLYWGRHFYIEALIWSNSTTLIHQHAFSGAFKVLMGGSVHTKYRFERERNVSPDCYIGSIQPEFSEHLDEGSIREIEPGPKGLLHSLFHLENPSISLVIRTHAHPAYLPQMTFYLPGLAFNAARFKREEVVVMLVKLMSVGASYESPMLDFWASHIATLDFGRMAWLYLHYGDQFLESNEHEGFLESVKKHHGAVTDLLKNCWQINQTQHRIRLSRRLQRDPDLRFFLALLLNVPRKIDMMKLIANRFPDQRPEVVCARFLVQLAQGKLDKVSKMKELVQRFESDTGGTLNFRHRLGAIVPDNSHPELLESVVIELLDSGSHGSSSGVIDPGPSDRAAHNKLRQSLLELDELRGLFTT